MTEKYKLESIFQLFLCPIERNESIIYGKINTYNLILTFLKKKVSYKFVLGTNSIEHKIECRVIQNGQYLCAVAHGYTIHIYLFSHLSIGNGKCEMKKTLYSTLNNAMTNHTYIELYDTASNTKKILCAKNRETFEIECLLFILTITTQTGTTSCSQMQSVATTTIILIFPTS